MARELCIKEGIFCGISSGCNVVAAIKIAERHPDLKTIVTMANDTGTRYFSTGLFGEKKSLETPEREHTLDSYTTQQLERYQHRFEIIE
jgi:cysteine synthase A